MEWNDIKFLISLSQQRKGGAEDEKKNKVVFSFNCTIVYIHTHFKAILNLINK